MHIINLTPSQYKNYANIHNTKSFGQTYEYSTIIENKLYLGMIDESNNLYAATFLIIKNISPKIKEAYAKDGFIIDYTNINLLNQFIIELKKYLKKIKITYLITNPKFNLYTYNKENNLVKDNSNILSTFLHSGFVKDEYNDDFSKYNVVIENNNIDKIFTNFSRHTKRNIKENINMGITLHKGKQNEIELFYNMIKKKTNKNLSYFYNLINTYNTKENKVDIFFTKLNPQKFISNAKKIYEKELNRNERIYKHIAKHNGKMTELTLNKKIYSDTRLEKCKKFLNQAIDISSKHKESIIIGTCMTIKNNQEIYFLIDGYNEIYRNIYSNHLLKWAIIKKYAKLNYQTFNLGEIHKDYKNTLSKYRGQYTYKIGFGGQIIEYPPNLILTINKPLHFIYKTFYKKKKKR